MVKNLPGLYLLVGNIPWRREWLPTPVFLPGEFHGQRSLVGYSPWGHRRVVVSNLSDATQIGNEVQMTPRSSGSTAHHAF